MSVLSARGHINSKEESPATSCRGAFPVFLLLRALARNGAAAWRPPRCPALENGGDAMKMAVSEGDRSGVPPSESREATGRPIPVTGSRTSPHEVGLSFREIAEPGSGLLVTRAPPVLCARARWTPGSFPGRLPDTPKSSGPSRELRPLYRVSDRSLRPTRLRVDSSHGVLRPYDVFRESRSGSPGLASPGTFRPQGFSTHLIHTSSCFEARKHAISGRTRSFAPHRAQEHGSGAQASCAST